MASGSTRDRLAALARVSSWCRSASRRCSTGRRHDLRVVATRQVHRYRSHQAAAARTHSVPRRSGRCRRMPCWQPQSTLPQHKFYHPRDRCPSDATVAQEEIFGPVLAAMTFRTPSEAVELANNTTYGCSIWSESINVALDARLEIKGRSRLGQQHKSL